MGQNGPKSSSDAQMLCLGSTGSMCENLTTSFKMTPAIRVLENGMCLISRLKRCLGVSKDQRKRRSAVKSRRSSCNCTALVFVEDLAGGVWMTPEENRGRTWEGQKTFEFTLRIYTLVMMDLEIWRSRKEPECRDKEMFKVWNHILLTDM